MDSERSRFDIFICAHAGDFPKLLGLLPRLRPFGSVHVGSSYLTPAQVEEVRPLCDVVHEPRHDPNGYDNFALFCVRDLNGLARAPWFIKLDCDIALADDWIDYVDEGLAEHPEAVLFGTHSGTNRVDFDISGPLVRRRLGRDLVVRSALKVNGSFYVARRDFFAAHDRTMQILHDFIWAFRNGRRVRPAHLPFDDAEGGLGAGKLVRLQGTCRNRQGTVKEDELRSLVAHAVGAGKRLFVRDAGERIVLPDKVVPPSRLTLAAKWLKRRLGIPMYHTR
jgi:hypothetical protein